MGTESLVYSDNGWRHLFGPICTIWTSWFFKWTNLQKDFTQLICFSVLRGWGLDFVWFSHFFHDIPIRTYDFPMIFPWFSIYRGFFLYFSHAAKPGQWRLRRPCRSAPSAPAVQRRKPGRGRRGRCWCRCRAWGWNRKGKRMRVKWSVGRRILWELGRWWKLEYIWTISIWLSVSLYMYIYIYDIYIIHIYNIYI